MLHVNGCSFWLVKLAVFQKQAKDDRHGKPRSVFNLASDLHLYCNYILYILMNISDISVKTVVVETRS